MRTVLLKLSDALSKGHSQLTTMRSMSKSKKSKNLSKEPLQLVSQGRPLELLLRERPSAHEIPNEPQPMVQRRAAFLGRVRMQRSPSKCA